MLFSGTLSYGLMTFLSYIYVTTTQANITTPLSLTIIRFRETEQFYEPRKWL